MRIQRSFLEPLLASSLLLVPAMAAAANPESKPAALTATKKAASEVAPIPAVPVTSATFTPPRAKPGELVRIDVEAEGATKLSGTMFERSPYFFEVKPGHWRAFVAVPVTAKRGKANLALTVHRARSKRTIRATLGIDARQFTSHKLRVAQKFTKQSEERRRRVREDRKAFRKAYSVEPGPPLFEGNFLNPREGARLNSRFGERRVFNGQLKSRHMGLDLDGRTGDPVLAANDGVVTMVRDCFGSGNTVIVSHGAGLFTGYFHLSEFKVELGEKVKRGQLIGLVGATGRVTGPHLHLSARANGYNFDPESLLAFDFVEAPAIAGADGEVEAAAE